MGEHPVADRHREQIGYSFAIASKEVTVQQFQRFLNENPRIQFSVHELYSPEPTCPVNSVSWYDAVAYCNWVSKKDEIAEDQWCYGANAKGDYAEGMKLLSNVENRTGYRLPTEAEWEYSCRAGSATGYSFGQPWELLKKYGWYNENSRNRTRPVGGLKPNDLGLFDLHGNICEWCQDRWAGRPETEENAIKKHISLTESTNDRIHRLLRGGTFDFHPALVRSAIRDRNAPSSRLVYFGFRPARTHR
jgi:formylglycine-generating enzyme required for sulfatase activity